MGHIKRKLRADVDYNKGRTAGDEQRLEDTQKHVDTVHGKYIEKQKKRINQLEATQKVEPSSGGHRGTSTPVTPNND